MVTCLCLVRREAVAGRRKGVPADSGTLFARDGSRRSGDDGSALNRRSSRALRHTASLAGDALPPALSGQSEVAEHVLRGEPFCFRAEDARPAEQVSLTARALS